MAKTNKKITTWSNSNILLSRVFFDLLIVTLAFIFIYQTKIITFCNYYTNVLFDAQALLTWDYVISKGLLPYRDFFYPYGLLQLFKIQSVWGHIWFFFFCFMILYGYLFLFKKVCKDYKVSIAFFFTFCFFVQQYAGGETFSRYGISLLVSSLSAWGLFANKQLLWKAVLFVGLMNGLTFALVNDQGIIALLIVSVLLIIKALQLFRENSISLQDIIRLIPVFLSGFLIGLIPLLMYLSVHNLYRDYIIHAIRLKDMSEYAKVPFFTGAKNIENIFAIVMILAAIWMLFYKFVLSKKVQVRHMITLAALLCLFTIEQKNIIRSISSVLPFLSYFILLLLVLDMWESNKRSKLQYIGLLILLFIPFIVGFSHPQTLTSTRMITDISGIQFDIQRKLNNSCYLENVEDVSSGNSIYKQLVSHLKKLPDRELVYSFPSDSLVYAFLNQPTPYYSNAYDASSKFAQEKQMEFMRRSSYIVYNQAKPFTQDMVPHYIRNPDEMQELLTHYTIDSYVGSFIIFKRQKNADVIEEQQNSKSDFIKYFLEVSLESIPYSEGFHKSSFLSYNNSITFNSIDEINTYLKKNSIKTDHKLFIIHNNEAGMTKLIIDTKDKMSTSISFKSCSSNTPCIINLDRIPLFYTSRQIARIISNQKVRLNIIEKGEDSVFW